MSGADAESRGGDGPLAGLRVAFTGRLEAMPRKEAYALVCRLGGEPVERVTRRTDLLVVGLAGWPGDGEGASLKLRRAETLQAQGHPIRVLSEPAFLERCGLRERVPRGERLPLERAARLARLEPATVRRCIALGLVGDGEGGLGFTDLAALRGIAPLLEAGVTPTEIAAAVARLRRVAPHLEHPLAQIRLAARDGTLVATVEGACLTPEGQHLLPLDVGKGDLTRVEEDLATGLEAEQRGDWIAAERCYRRALEAEPRCGPAWHNLAGTLVARGRLREAERCLRQAVRLLPALPQAWRMLGYVLDRLDRPGAALRSLRRAVRLAPDYAEGHMALAVVAERMGRTDEAFRHWRHCLAHAEDPRMAALARRRMRALARSQHNAPDGGQGRLDP